MIRNKYLKIFISWPVSAEAGHYTRKSFFHLRNRLYEPVSTHEPAALIGLEK